MLRSTMAAMSLLQTQIWIALSIVKITPEQVAYALDKLVAEAHLAVQLCYLIFVMQTRKRVSTFIRYGFYWSFERLLMELFQQYYVS
jgi:hypothetical protein